MKQGNELGVEVWPTRIATSKEKDRAKTFTCSSSVSTARPVQPEDDLPLLRLGRTPAAVGVDTNSVLCTTTSDYISKEEKTYCTRNVHVLQLHLPMHIRPKTAFNLLLPVLAHQVDPLPTQGLCFAFYHGRSESRDSS
nr:hypothetical protein CFP56_10145 [Quercus suber]